MGKMSESERRNSLPPGTRVWKRLLVTDLLIREVTDDAIEIERSHHLPVAQVAADP